MVLAIALALIDPTFPTARNLSNVARQVTIVGIIGVGMTMVILIAGIQAIRSLVVRQYPRSDNATVTVVQLIYREAFQRQNLGAAAAISVIVLFALLVLNAVQFRLLRDPERS